MHDRSSCIGRRIACRERILKLFVELAFFLLVRGAVQPTSDRMLYKEIHGQLLAAP